ncbi:MAG: DUF624 domain-containing protein [Clostridiales bacterium]|jgi:uncharacterized membrane protein YesL|nr:DUF624 domain-containing protein [Clostridiales bacterium]
MSNFFSLEGSFYKFGSLLADIIILSLAWLVCSIPVVTAGASTTALFYVATRRIANREGYILRDFWTSFKSNFKRSTLLWLIQLALTLIVIFNLLNIGLMGEMGSFLFPLQILLAVEIAFFSVYLAPLTARFELSFVQTIKNAFFIAHRHLLTTITCVILGAAIILGVILMPILFFIAMGLYAWLSSYMIMRVFKKYRPEMDKDPAQELQEIEARLNAEKDPLTEFQRLEAAKIEAGEAKAQRETDESANG